MGETELKIFLWLGMMVIVGWTNCDFFLLFAYMMPEGGTKFPISCSDQ